jgi:hypothetical protein
MGSAVVGCSGNVNDVTIATGDFLIGPEGVKFDIEPPLLRTKNALSIRLRIDEEWEPEPPWEKLLMKDGRRVTVTARLIAVDGSQYDSSQVGRADGVNLRFLVPPPIGKPIVAVIVTADSPIRCRAVNWHDYNSL